MGSQWPCETVSPAWHPLCLFGWLYHAWILLFQHAHGPSLISCITTLSTRTRPGTQWRLTAHRVAYLHGCVRVGPTRGARHRAILSSAARPQTTDSLLRTHGLPPGPTLALELGALAALCLSSHHTLSKGHIFGPGLTEPAHHILFPRAPRLLTCGCPRAWGSCALCHNQNFFKVWASRARWPSLPPALAAFASFEAGIFSPCLTPSCLCKAPGCLIAFFIHCFAIDPSGCNIKHQFMLSQGLDSGL